jgi:hypothetical protein
VGVVGECGIVSGLGHGTREERRTIRTVN